MSDQIVFVQRGNTKRISAGVWPAISSVQMSVATGFPPTDNYIITNFGPSTAFVGYGSTSAAAIANAKVPASGDTAGVFCFVVCPGQQSIEAKDGVYFAAVNWIAPFKDWALSDRLQLLQAFRQPS